MMECYYIFKGKMTLKDKQEIFKKLEDIGYKTIIAEKEVGKRNETRLWVAINEKNQTIIYNHGCFEKGIVGVRLCFTEEEYKIIRNF